MANIYYYSFMPFTDDNGQTNRKRPIRLLYEMDLFNFFKWRILYDGIIIASNH